MKLKTFVSTILVAACPLLMAPTNITGSLSGFSQGTSGGQSPSAWGLPQSSTGQNSSQSSSQSAQSSSQSSTAQNSTSQSSSQSAQSSSQSSPGQNSSSQSSSQNSSSNNSSTQDPKGEPNESNDGSTQDPKGEPNPSGDGSGGGTEGDFPGLDPGDGEYDPTKTEDDTEIPSGCAEAGSQCAQCVRDAEANIQFNRHYLHTAWSITHSTIEFANKQIAFGDSVSGIHGAMALSWQLAGKPQIDEAVADLRKTYAKKYRDYSGHIENSLRKMANCEQENFATRDLYQRFGFLYSEFIRSRYESPD